jgi:hypothetical protein
MWYTDLMHNGVRICCASGVNQIQPQAIFKMELGTIDFNDGEVILGTETILLSHLTPFIGRFVLIKRNNIVVFIKRLYPVLPVLWRLGESLALR